MAHAKVYICPKCLVPSKESGTCPDCGIALQECNPGASNDPCRRPVKDSDGNLRSHAPLWWIRRYAPELCKYYETNNNNL